MNETDTGFSLEDRLPCADETCVGIIGPDGRCGVCGRLYEGDEQIPRTNTDLASEGGSLSRGFEEQAAPAAEASEAPFDPDDRVCCDDDACIGIIGKDGKCGTCGKQSLHRAK